MRTRLQLNQRGDTLIEVVIATVIIGMVLFSAYTLSSQAYKLGQSAKERTQATELIQEQAEGLRALRDNASSWSSFRSQLPASPFHLVKTANNWLPVSGTYNPADGDNNLPNYYTLSIEVEPSAQDRLVTTIAIRWQRLGGGPDELSSLHYHLTDRSITIPAS